MTQAASRAKDRPAGLRTNNNCERYDLVDARRDMATRTPRAVHVDGWSRASSTAAATSTSALSRDRPQGVHPDLVRVVERAIRTQDFRVQEGLRTRERQAARWSRAAPAGP